MFLGVDVGGTKVAAGVVRQGELCELAERPTATHSATTLLDGIEEAIGELIERTGPPVAVGVGVPSQIEFATGRVMSSVNLPLEDVALREEFERRLGVPVFVDNDGNCAAAAEAALAAGGPAQHLVMLTLGTGVGGGIIAGGHVLRGATGLGSELGHLVVDSDGPECPGNCPNRGCLEALCSGQALERDARVLARERPSSPLGRVATGGARVRGRDVVAAAREGDADARDLLERFGTWLGVGISSLLNVFEPGRVAIGGGLSAAADLFLDRAREEAMARTLPAIAARSEIGVARSGTTAGVIGAARLAALELARA